MIASFLSLLGVFSFIGVLRCFWPFIACKVLGSKSLKSQGKWAVVTGATDGIGKAYCEALASRGLNILLISRTKSKLETVAAEIKEQFKVETKIVAADFSKINDAGFDSPIALALNDLEVGVLVNNVGMSYTYPSWFAEEDTTMELLNNLVSLNVSSTTLMSKLVIPGMVARKKGVVINLSSAAGNMPCGSPGLAGYSATKAYVNALSKSIQHEVASKGVTVQCHVPYFVKTNMSKIRKTSMGVPSADGWVASSLAMVGHGGTTIIPFFPHFVQDFLMTCVPEEVSAFITNYLHKDIRKRALKKKEREAAAAK